MRDIEQAMNVRADFDQFLLEKDEENARACIDAMGEKGEELEALKMHQEFNRTFDPIVPFEQEIPVMTPAEKRAWDDSRQGSHDLGIVREGDEKY